MGKRWTWWYCIHIYTFIPTYPWKMHFLVIHDRQYTLLFWYLLKNIWTTAGCTPPQSVVSGVLFFSHHFFSFPRETRTRVGPQHEWPLQVAIVFVWKFHQEILAISVEFDLVGLYNHAFKILVLSGYLKEPFFFKGTGNRCWRWQLLKVKVNETPEICPRFSSCELWVGGLGVNSLRDATPNDLGERKMGKV